MIQPLAGGDWSGVALGLFLVTLLIQRGIELHVSANHVRLLIARGAREFAPGHFPLLVILHACFPVCLLAEVAWLGARPGSIWPLWLGVWLGAQLLRYSALAALGERWTVGIWVLPGVPPVRGGPYRWLRHPNYIAVVTELLAAPLFFGAWRTALVIGLVNLLALRIRIREEERALGMANPGALGANAIEVPAGD